MNYLRKELKNMCSDISTKFGLSKEYLVDAKKRSKQVIVSELESEIVNKWTVQDVFLDMILHNRGKSYNERLSMMIQGKVEDYQFFVVLYEDNKNKLPKKINDYMQYSACGQAKLEALELRTRNN